MLSAALRELGVTEDCIDEIRLALSEACSNVVKHSDDSDEYEVRLEVEDSVCEIRVVDAGRGWDASDLNVEMPAPNAAHGRGVAMMQAVMDATNFDSHPASGSVVRLTKLLTLTPTSPMRGPG